MVHNTANYDRNITTSLCGNTTYETPKSDPTNNYKQKVIDYLQDLEKDKVIDCSFYHRLYLEEVIPTPCIYGPKIHKDPLTAASITMRNTTSSFETLVGITLHHIQIFIDFVKKI